MKNPFKNRSIISAKDFSREELEFLFGVADDIKEDPSKYRNELKGKKVALVFLEPSTRTFSSFFTAAMNAGCDVISFQDSSVTSIAKGETLFDTLKMIEGYGIDCIVLRHYYMGSAKFADEIVDVPIINAGSGSQEHPTQAMLDLYTILKKKNKIDGLKIGFLGDLRFGRTCPSLSYILSNYNIEIFYVAPQNLQIRKEVEIYLDNKGIKYKKTSDIREVIKELDVLYVTRIQKERFPDLTEYEKVKSFYSVDLNLLSLAKKDLGVMHPLPRVDELSSEVDKTPYAWYFEQAKNGLYIREALLNLILDQNEK